MAGVYENSKAGSSRAPAAAADSPELAFGKEKGRSASPDEPPYGRGPRRAATVDENAGSRRRTMSGIGFEEPMRAPARRGSSFSEYSQEVRDILDPTHDSPPSSRPHEASNWDKIVLIPALLPAVGGILFQGGDAFVTDLMLLGLGAIFLYWSVTQPWAWYHSAQQVRVVEELSAEVAVESESDAEGEEEEEESPLEDIPEDAPVSAKQTPAAADSRRLRLKASQDALKKLYRHEVLALIFCFISPVLGAYLLHTIREQLTRPSEGLVSNYNLSIFILGAELRPMAHLIKLVQARTLHLQRIVHASALRDDEARAAAAAAAVASSPPSSAALDELLVRLGDLEARTDAAAAVAADAANEPRAAATKRADARRERDSLLREVRAQMQPEFDTLARALRRVHKQQTLLAAQVEAKFRATDLRLNDAVSLAAAAARNSDGSVLWGLLAWLVNAVVFAPLLPFQVVAQLFSRTIDTVLHLFGRKSRTAASEADKAPSRGARVAGPAGKVPPAVPPLVSPARAGPARVSRRG